MIESHPITDMYRPTLAQLISDFTAEHSLMSQHKNAWGMCCVMSEYFVAFAQEHGYEFKTYTFYATDITQVVAGSSFDRLNPEPGTYYIHDAAGQRLQNENGKELCAWHSIVDAGHVLIDFTARQYNKDYAFPHIIPVEERLIDTHGQSVKWPTLRELSDEFDPYQVDRLVAHAKAGA